MACSFNCKLLLLLAILEVAAGTRIKDMIYTPIDSQAACFRRHNGTHQFGCSSSRSGSIGAIHFIGNETDLEWLEFNSTAGPYVTVMSFSMFTRDTLLRLRKTNNINGILLANTTKSRPSHYSPEDTCPNRYSGARECKEKPWNPLGSALLMEDWPFPIFFIQNQTALEEINSCFLKHNAHDLDDQSQRSLCALEMKSFMFAAVDSETCIRRSLSANIHSTLYCEPLGDRNIHWSISPAINESVILVTARLDATAMFNDLVPGAGSTVTGLVTFLATAYYLKALNATVKNTNVMFTLMNGEAYDYIGSSRMVYDLKEGHFKTFTGNTLDLNHISSVIDLGQLGPGKLYLHTANAENSTIVADLKNSLPASVLTDSVPPSSVNSFLKGKSNISTIVVANHGEEFENKYYHSLLDDKPSLGDEKALASSLAKVAIKLGNALYKSVTGSSPPPESDETDEITEIISHMLPCYLVSANCSLFLAATPPGTIIANRNLPLYVSVRRVDNSATSLTAQLLAYLTGDVVPGLNSTACHKKSLFWMSGKEHNLTGVCINSTVYFTNAVSPAFVIDGYDMSSGNYSTWTESIWESLSVRMFLKPSPATERLSMAVGSTVAILSIIVVWFFNSRADIIFKTRSENL